MFSREQSFKLISRPLMKHKKNNPATVYRMLFHDIKFHLLLNSYYWMSWNEENNWKSHLIHFHSYILPSHLLKLLFSSLIPCFYLNCIYLVEVFIINPTDGESYNHHHLIHVLIINIKILLRSSKQFVTNPQVLTRRRHTCISINTL